MSREPNYYVIVWTCLKLSVLFSFGNTRLLGYVTVCSFFPSLVIEAMGPSRCWAKEIGHRFAIQKKREVIELIPARKDFENLVCYFNVFALNICTPLGRQISDFVLLNLSNVVLYYLLYCIKMIERVKGKVSSNN